MSAETTNQSAQQETEEKTVSILDEVIAITDQDSEKNYTEGLIKTFVEEALEGTVVWSGNFLKTIAESIKKIDKIVSAQVREILHDSKLQKIEGTWRGLHHLIKNTVCSTQLKIKIFNVDKSTLLKNFRKSLEFDQSVLFKKVYEEEYGTAGGAPYGALIGDYEFDNHPDDIDLLDSVSQVAAASFAPFIASAPASVLGLKSWDELNSPVDLQRIFESPAYAKWNNFRQKDESKFVSLTMPRTLARMPYGKATSPVEEFDFEEFDTNDQGIMKKASESDYCWMSTAYTYGTVITRSFFETGFCTAIRGMENGGKVDNLAAHTFLSDDGEIDMACPTEIGITDRREAELSKLGFLPLCHYKNEAYAVFFGGQTTHIPTQYDDPDATANSEISARIPYIFATSRIAHYLKVIARDKIGSFMEVDDVSAWLNRWINQYVNSNPASGQLLKSRFPLAEAKIKVTEVPGKPGSFNAVAWLRPWLQLEEITASLRLVAKIPG